jgi:hypothetical protein
MRHYPLLSLFTTAFLQVFLVAGSTVFIARNNYPGEFLTAFGISWLWTSNVRKIAVSSAKERFVYAIGAACGGTFGMYIANQFH